MSLVRSKLSITNTELAHLLAFVIITPAVYVAYWLYVRYIERRDLEKLGRDNAMEEFMRGAMIGFGLFAMVMAILWMLGFYRVHGFEIVRLSLIGALAGAFVSAFAQELIFRGVLYRITEASLEESLQLCKQSGNRWGMGTAYRYWGLAKMAQGKLEDAQSLFHKSIDTFGDYFIGWDIARSATYLAEAHRLADDLVESRRVYWEALRISKEAESTPLMLDSLVGLAQLDLQDHMYQQAFEVSNFVQKHVASTQETKDRASQISMEAEKHLGSDEVQEFKEKAAKPSLEMIVDRLLSG